MPQQKRCPVRQERNVTAGCGETALQLPGGAETWDCTEQEIPEPESTPQCRDSHQREWIPKNLPHSRDGELYLKGSHALFACGVHGSFVGKGWG